MSKRRSETRKPSPGTPADQHPQRISQYPETMALRLAAKAIRFIVTLPIPRAAGDRVMRALKIEPESFRSHIKTIVDFAPDLFDLPDSFNELLGGRGWLAYESINIEVVRSAIAAAKEGRQDDAEALLCRYLRGDALEYGINRMASVRRFQPRIELARLAAKDHDAGRYYASVLVLLSLADGIVADLSLNNRGFFHRDPDLTAWGSMSGHPTGLLRISKLFGATRTTTTTEAIKIPFRHGIVHGRDTNFNQELVSAKAWAMIFAIGDWARAVERGTHVKPEAKPLRESLRAIGELALEASELKKFAEAWEPRKINVTAQDNPDAETFELGTPERVLAEYLHAALQKSRYGLMAQRVRPKSGVPTSTQAGTLAKELKGITLQRFRIKNVTDVAPALTTIDVECTYNETDLTVGYRLLCTTEKGDPVPRGYRGGCWYVVNYIEPVFDLMIEQDKSGTSWLSESGLNENSPSEPSE